MLCEVEPLVEYDIVFLSVASDRLERRVRPSHTRTDPARRYRLATARGSARLSRKRASRPRCRSRCRYRRSRDHRLQWFRPAPCVPKFSSSMPCFWKIPAFMPSVGVILAHASIWPIATFSLSAANAGCGDHVLREQRLRPRLVHATASVTPSYPLHLLVYRGGICRIRPIAPWSSASRNFSFTASATAPSRSAI